MRKFAAVETALANDKASPTIRNCTDFLLLWVFPFIKYFDAKLPLDDLHNYYMEREWRVCGNVEFALKDVSRVFFPASYAARFRTDLPCYFGQISFVD
jgi:hypothetical protein